MRARLKFVYGASAVAALVVLTQVLAGPAATAQSQAATQRVIVLLKNQEQSLTAAPSTVAARRNAIAQTQRPLVQQLSSTGAQNVHSYTLINALSATVSPAEEAQLKANPAVSEVVPDAIIRLNSSRQSAGSAAASAAAPAKACTPPNQVELDPQAIETVHADSDNPKAATARSLGITGAGVKVAFIADGLDIHNQDFIRANGQHVFVTYKDFSGEGTGVHTGGGEAFLDASSIAAQGLHTYDVSNYSALPLSQPCKIRIEGMAPGASLVGLDIFGREDTGFTSAWLQAIDFAVSAAHVQVLNQSLGGNPYPDDPAALDVIKTANDQAVAAGTTVTASTGDAGITNTLSTPADDPNVIGVGASTTFRQVVQEGLGGRWPDEKGWLDNNISALSSAGFDQAARTQDVVAPGDSNWALCSTDVARYNECTDDLNRPAPVQATGGTSESSPLTAGEAALVIQAYRKTHGGASPTPAVVKQIIASTADDIGSPADQQGAGLIDAYRAVVAAESYKASSSTPRPVGNSLLVSQSQLNAVDSPGAGETFTEQVTNNAAGVQTVSVSSRTLSPYRQIKSARVTLSDSGPHFSDWHGIRDNYQLVTFNVPQGQNRLDTKIAYQAAVLGDLNSRVRVTMIDPLGRLAAYSEPQGTGNYGEDQITNPAPGQWRAYISSRDSADGGSTGPVLFSANVAKYGGFGKVTPRTLTLGSRQTGTVTLHVSTPSSPGDASGSIVLSTDSGPSFARTSTVPVTLRSLIPMGNQSFGQTLTGGNGRGFNTGQEFFYQLDVPAGMPELNAAVTLADNPHNPFSAWLVSPSGEALAFASNEFPDNSAQGFSDQIGAQLHVLAPAQGAWKLLVAFVPQVSGQALTEPFTVSTSETRVKATATGLPNSAATQLPAGQTTTAHVTIKNSGPAPEAYFFDARLPTKARFTLAPFGDDTSQLPLTINSNIPAWIVPTQTSSLVGHSSTTGPQPIITELSAATGDPDLASIAGSSVSVSHAAVPVSQGLWAVIPGEAGAFGHDAGPSETAVSSMSAVTKQFDTTISSPTGDLWPASTNLDALDSWTPVIVEPGQSVTLPVKIKPKGASGTVVSGKLYIDDANLFPFQVFFEPNGNQVAALPYQYTIK